MHFYISRINHVLVIIIIITYFISANNLKQVANLLCAQANSASYPQRDGK